LSLSEEVETGLATAPGDRALAAWEIVSVVMSVLIAEWLVLSLAGGNRLVIAIPVAVAFAFMLFSHRLRRETARDVGFRFDNFTAAVKLLLLTTLVPAALLLVVGWYMSSINFMRWRGGQSIFGLPALGVLWGLLQQYVLQGFINRRAQLIWGRGKWSILVVALVFAALHLPNPLLTLATFAGGLVWAWVYQRAPNLLALGLSHGLMTWVLISTVPASALHGLRVGFKYFG
jgi:membrane protease YdiL (CAAX protease family)